MRLTKRLKQSGKIIVCAALAGCGDARAQGGVVTLQQVHLDARARYPMLEQQDLAQMAATLNQTNLSKGFLPQVSLNGQATYQSDVTKVSIPFPGISVPTPGKDQYKVTADLNQVVFDGGVIRSQQNLLQLNADVEKQKVDVELYRLRERVNQLYFGVLLIDAQLKQAGLVQEDILNGIRKTDAQVAEGLTFRSNADVLRAQLLLSEQRKTELSAARKGMVEALSLLDGKDLSNSTFLEPGQTPIRSDELHRPELGLYERQSAYLEGQKKALFAKNLPKASFFAQAGYGRPGLNMLDNKFDTYYIAGVRLNWTFGGWYTYKKERQVIDNAAKSVALQDRTFRLNTNVQLAQLKAEVDKLSALIDTDKQIIALRERIKQAANAQLANQVITANDYLREVNAEDQAKQALILHTLQLQLARFNYITTAGNDLPR